MRRSRNQLRSTSFKSAGIFLFAWANSRNSFLTNLPYLDSSQDGANLTDILDIGPWPHNFVCKQLSVLSISST